MKIFYTLFKIIKKLIIEFKQNYAGNIIIAFAIMLPLIIACFAVSLNNAYILRSRAAISEATNEASLAIVAINNKNKTIDDIEKNKVVALNYINYYLDNNIDSNINDASLYVDYLNEKYHVFYQKDVNALFKINSLGSLGTSISVGNKNKTYGNTQRFYTIESIDIGFIADFSASTTCDLSDESCNQYTATSGGKKRLDYMRNAIGDVVNFFEPYSNINFAFIPYDIGVPVKNDLLNPAGGNSYSCSLLYKLKAPYDQLDYNFWANNYIDYNKWKQLFDNGIIGRDNANEHYLKFDYFQQYRNSIYYHLDYYRYYYYANIVGPSLNYNNDEELTNSGLCVKQQAVNSVNLGQFKYSCGIDESSYPLSPPNSAIVENQYAKLVQLYDYMYSGNYNTHYSFANTLTVDVDGTLNQLFSNMDNNIITFTRPIAPSMSEFTPFMAMCLSPIYSNKLMIGNDDKLDNDVILKNSIDNIKQFKDSPHLIPFSNDSSELSQYLLNNSWSPGGGTDTMTALLRSVPVFAKGKGNHKIIIIISDGKDDQGADILRDQFLGNNVCQVITEGLTSSENQQLGYITRAANTVSFYYIKLVPDKSTGSIDYDREFSLWYSNCMEYQQDHFFLADSYDALLDITKYIIQSHETGVFINQ